jgi:hypothetical protein
MAWVGVKRVCSVGVVGAFSCEDAICFSSATNSWIMDVRTWEFVLGLNMYSEYGAELTGLLFMCNYSKFRVYLEIAQQFLYALYLELVELSVKIWMFG